MCLVLGLGSWSCSRILAPYPILSVLGGDKVGRKEREDVGRGWVLFLKVWDVTLLCQGEWERTPLLFC